MRRLGITLLLALGLLIPMGAMANDVPDGQDCRDGNAAPASLGATSGADADRGAACVHAGGTTVFYLGGEAQSEDNPGSGGACGSLIVAGNTLQGTDDWDNAGADGIEGTADDEHC
ncbi:MAG TPA: hypothetical protein VNA87_07485 [Actinomycetota bacterium]|nr:hypothetical protein [Actinomycetota bacterium]